MNSCLILYFIIFSLEAIIMFTNKIVYTINIEIQPTFIKDNKEATRSDVWSFHSAIEPIPFAPFVVRGV